mgnify:CR=1 FL=1
MMRLGVDGLRVIIDPVVLLAPVRIGEMRHLPAVTEIVAAIAWARFSPPLLQHGSRQCGASYPSIHKLLFGHGAEYSAEAE